MDKFIILQIVLLTIITLLLIIVILTLKAKPDVRYVENVINEPYRINEYTDHSHVVKTHEVLQGENDALRKALKSRDDQFDDLITFRDENCTFRQHSAVEKNLYEKRLLQNEVTSLKEAIKTLCSKRVCTQESVDDYIEAYVSKTNVENAELVKSLSATVAKLKAEKQLGTHTHRCR